MTDPIVISDTFTDTNGDPWNPTVWPTIRELFVLGAPSPQPTIQANAGQMVAADGGTFIAAFTVPEVTGFDLTFKLQRPDLGEHDFSAIGYRIGNNITSGVPSIGYEIQIEHTAGNFGIGKLPSHDAIAYIHAAAIQDGAAYQWRLRVKQDRHRLKWWPDGDPEPSTWDIDVLDSTYLSAGRMYVGLYNGTTGGTTVIWDDYTMTELLPPDPGIRVAGSFDPVVALNVGAEPVVAAYKGTVPIVVP